MVGHREVLGALERSGVAVVEEQVQQRSKVQGLLRGFHFGLLGR